MEWWLNVIYESEFPGEEKASEEKTMIKKWKKKMLTTCLKEDMSLGEKEFRSLLETIYFDVLERYNNKNLHPQPLNGLFMRARLGIINEIDINSGPSPVTEGESFIELNEPWDYPGDDEDRRRELEGDDESEMVFDCCQILHDKFKILEGKRLN